MQMMQNPNAVTHTLPSFNDAKQVFSPPPDAPNHEEQAERTLGLSLQKFLSFGCFDLRYVLFFVTAETEVGYGDWQKLISSGLSDTFQITGRQSDFRQNHRWVMCNYPKN